MKGFYEKAALVGAIGTVRKLELPLLQQWGFVQPSDLPFHIKVTSWAPAGADLTATQGGQQ
jgi:hypothetical protein